MPLAVTGTQKENGALKAEFLESLVTLALLTAKSSTL